MARKEDDMLGGLVILLASVCPVVAFAGTKLIDTAKLPSTEACGVAKLTPLALSPSGTPAVVLLDLEAGDVVPPHASKTGLRPLTVIFGDISWGQKHRR